MTINFSKQSGATTILLAMFVLNVILLIALTAATIIMYEVKMVNEMASSVPAFYAADAGAEKCLYQVRKTTGDGCDSAGLRQTTVSLDNGATGQANFNGAVKINASGAYKDTKRNVEVTW